MPAYSEIEGASQLDEGKDGSVNVLDMLFLLARHRRRIALVTLVSLALGVVIAFLLRPVYTATALILPPQQEQSAASSLLGSLGSLASLGGGGGGASSLLKNPADMYIGILQSNTIADALIYRFRLQSVYRKKTLHDARATLEKHADFETKKDGLIHISITDHNPQRASDLANGFIDQLYRVNSTLAITDTAQRRLFFSQQVADEKTELDKAEDALAATQLKTGIIQLTGQAEIILLSMSQVEAQITSDQVQLEGLLASSTEQNPNVQRLRQEITELQSQLSKLQDSQSQLRPGDTRIPAGRLPQDSLAYMRSLRDVKYHEALFELLSRQYAAARIDEAKSSPLIQVVDRATTPDKRSGPPRLLIILGVGFAGFLLASLWSLCSDAFQRMRSLPEYRAKIEQMRTRSHS